MYRTKVKIMMQIFHIQKSSKQGHKSSYRQYSICVLAQNRQNDDKSSNLAGMAMIDDRFTNKLRNYIKG